MVKKRRRGGTLGGEGTEEGKEEKKLPDIKSQFLYFRVSVISPSRKYITALSTYKLYIKDGVFCLTSLALITLVSSCS